ncbi:MAG: bile acid:sodium symporter family protein [Peptococcaceae bacterium]|jgi:predicted Na+-dependent transporter|nr:bile acid:sodium symporter family protein [Peptococcaceae bacterium]
MNTLMKWNSWLNKHMFIIVFSAMVFGFLSGIEKSPTVNAVIIALFAYMTLVGSLNSSFREFFALLKRPWQAIWILILIHAAIPLFAWGMGRVFYADDEAVRMGFLIAAVIPIAVSSLLWVTTTEGNIPLTLVTITLDTFITPLLLPVFFFFCFGKAVKIDYFRMIFELMLMVTIPSIIGMFLHDRTHQRLAVFSKSIGGLTSKLAMFVIVGFNASIIAPFLHWNGWLVRLLLCIAFMVAGSYGVGYLGSLPLRKEGRATMICVIYNVGMRNIAFGSVLAFTYFPLAVVVPVTLFSLFQQPLAGVVAYLLERGKEKRGRERRRG